MVASTPAGSRPARSGEARHRRIPEVPRSLAVVLVLALVLRLAWVLYAEREPNNFGDPATYMFLARSIAQGQGYHLLLSTRATAFHPVGYPGWVAGIVWAAIHLGLSAHEPLLIGLVQALLGTVSVALVYAIAARLFDGRVAIVAAALTACFPSLVVYAGLEYSETLYLFGVLLAVWIVVRSEWNPAPGAPALLAFGLVVGLSSLVRPFALLSLLPLAVAALRAGAGLRATARAVVIAGGVTVLVLVPWTIRNELAFHAFVPISTNLGDTLCIDNSPGAYGGFRALPPECSAPARSSAAERARNSHNVHVAVSWAAHHPATEATLVFRRAYYAFRSDHDGITDLVGAHGSFPPRRVRGPLDLLSDAYYFVVLALSVPGLVAFGRDPRRLFVLLVGATIAVVPLLLYGLPRFHIPLLPFVALGAAVTIDALERARRARRVRAQAKRRNSVI